jgi:hypothetical protein
MARKARIFSDDEIQYLKDLISLYREQHSVVSHIKYLDMFRFNKKMLEEGKFHEAFKEDFWRKKQFLGCQLIDSNNALFSKSYIKTVDEEITIPNVTYAVHTYKNEDDLIKHLLPLQLQLEKSISNENELQKKLQAAEEEIITFFKKIN